MLAIIRCRAFCFCASKLLTEPSSFCNVDRSSETPKVHACPLGVKLHRMDIFPDGPINGSLGAFILIS